MSPCAVSRACLLLLLGLAWSALGQGPTLAPAPATAPAPETLSPERVAELVRQLDGDSYQQRQAALNELKRIAAQPGAEALLKKHLASATGPQAKVSLEGLLTAATAPSGPLLMIWCRARITPLPNGVSSRAAEPAAPWLYVRADGSFVYDAACQLFSRKADPAASEFRQGRLSEQQLQAFKDALDKSRCVRTAAQPVVFDARLPQPAGWEVMVYARSGKEAKSGTQRWHQATIEGAAEADSDSDADLMLRLAKLVAAAETKPYAGPMALLATPLEMEPLVAATQPVLKPGLNDPPPPDPAIAKLPAWPVADAPLAAAGKRGGLPLDDEQLRAVRAALKAGDRYKLSPWAAARAAVFPRLPDALETYEQCLKSQQQAGMKWK